MFVRKFSIDQGNSDLYASSLVPWNDPKKNSSDQKPSKLKIFKFLSLFLLKNFYGFFPKSRLGISFETYILK